MLHRVSAIKARDGKIITGKIKWGLAKPRKCVLAP